MVKLNFEKLFVCTLFLIFQGFLSAQELQGTVRNSTGETIPFAKIKVQNTIHKTTANKDGFYKVTLKPGKYSVDFSAIGFESKVDTIIISNDSQKHDVVLSELTNVLEEVTVSSLSKRERGKEIMLQAIEKRPFYQDLLSEFSCNTYCLSTLRQDKYDTIFKDSVIGKETIDMIEWRAKSFYEKPIRFKDEFYAYNDFKDNSSNYNEVSFSVDIESNPSLAPQGSAISSNPYLFVNGMKEAHFSLLDNTIEAPRLTQNPLISPLAFNAMLFYAFYLEETYSDSLQRLIHVISVKPKFSYEALFEGKIHIQDSTWELVSYDLEVNPGVLIYFKNIRIKANYQRLGERIVPVSKSFVYSIKEGKKITEGNVTLSQSEFNFDKIEKPSKFWLETSSFDEKAFDRDSSYWEKNRPFSLNSIEQDYIHKQDSIINYHESDEYLHEQDSIRNRISFVSVFFNGIGHVNSFKKYSFTFNPLISQVIPFGVGGYRHRLQFVYRKEFKNGKYFTVEPDLDYGFLNKDLKGGIGGTFMYNPLNFSKVGFEIGDVYDFVTSNQNIQGTFAPSNRVRNKKISASFSRELINGLYLKSNILFSDRQSIDSLKYPSWISYFGNFQQAQTFEPYRIFLTTIDLEYHFRQKYFIRKNRKYVLGSPWPIINLTYKKGIPSFFGSQSNFDFAEFQVRDELNFKSFGNSDLKFVAGVFMQKQNLRVIENKFFRPSDRIFFSNPVNTLQLLDTALNTSNSYFQFNYIHHFNGFFLNKVWLINRLKLQETVGGNFLFIPDANFAQVEFYAGLERRIRIRRSIFKVGVYAVTQDNSLSKASINFKVGVNFYNAFTDKWDY